MWCLVNDWQTSQEGGGSVQIEKISPFPESNQFNAAALESRTIWGSIPNLLSFWFNSESFNEPKPTFGFLAPYSQLHWFFFFKNIYLLCKNSQAHTTELKQYKTNIKYNKFFGEKTPNSQHQRKTRSHKETSHSGTASPQSPSQKEMFQAQWKRSVKSLDGVPGGGNSRNGLVCLHGICH